MITSDTYSLLPEHAAPPQSSPVVGGNDYQPTDDEKKQLKLVEKLFSKAKRYRSQYDSKWLDYYKMFRGKQWKDLRPTYRHSEVINLVFQTIQSQVPIITDVRPKFEFLPQEPSDYELSDILNQIAEADWAKYNWQNVLAEIIYDGYFYGTGISCMKYDPDMSCIEFRSADPFYFFPDPDAEDVNIKCDFVVSAEPMDLAKIKRKWPDKGKYVKADLVELLRGNKSDLGPMLYRNPTDQRTMVEGDGTNLDLGDKEKALVLTVYVKSDEMVTDPVNPEDPSTAKLDIDPTQRKAFPNGKKIVVANNVLLDSGPNPYDDGKWPYQRWPNYILPREFWGISEIENLEGPQKTFNKLISFALDVLTLMGNPIWIVDNTSDVDTENLFNRPGQVVEKAPGTDVHREPGVQLQPYVLEIVDKLKDWFDQIAGSNDVTRGLNPTGVTAASAISSLQNAAQTRIRQKSRNLDCYLQSAGQQYLSRVFQFYTSPQIFRITNNQGATNYFKFHVDHNAEGQIDSNGNPMKPYTANIETLNEQGQSMGITQYQTEANLDVRVTTGSSLPFSKSDKEQKLFALFDRGIIDAEEVLKNDDYPNYEAVLQRMQEKQQQAAQAQQAGGGGKPGSAPPPAA